jgi:phosphopantothenoylcysteine decarboxylase / phosphopantothenate---cysteine ligase
MRAAVLEQSERADVVIMAAAVADYRPQQAASHKLKRSVVGKTMQLSLVANPDILAELGARRGKASSPLLVGFAAETQDVVRNAIGKAVSKRCDLVVANDVAEKGIGFGADANAVTIVDASGPVTTAEGDKVTVAHRILDQVVRHLEAKRVAAAPSRSKPRRLAKPKR